MFQQAKRVLSAQEDSDMLLTGLRSRAVESFVGGFEVAHLKVSRSRVTIQDARAGCFGAVLAGGAVTITDHSTLRISNCHVTSGYSAGIHIGAGGLHISGRSAIHIEGVSALDAAGLSVGGSIVVLEQSLLDISHSSSWGSPPLGRAAGFLTLGHLQVAGNSTVRIQHASANNSAGGFLAERGVILDANSAAVFLNTSAAGAGGGFLSRGEVTVSNGSRISVIDATSASNGGAFYCTGLRVRGGSHIEILNSVAAFQGGAALVEGPMLVADGSTVTVSKSQASIIGGAFRVDGNLEISHASQILLEDSTAGSKGGGVYASQIRVHDGSLLYISGATAGVDGGGFLAAAELQVQDSRVIIANANAGKSGGGFLARGAALVNRSLLQIRNSSAGQDGGGFNAQAAFGMIEHSTVNIKNCRAGSVGGGFGVIGEIEVLDSTLLLSGVKAESVAALTAEKSLLVERSKIRVVNSTARKNCGGIRGENVVVVASDVSFAHTTSVSGDGGAIRVRAMQVLEGSTIRIHNSTAGKSGGGIMARRTVRVANMSEIILEKTEAGLSGGALVVVGRLEVSDSTMLVSDSVSQVDGGGILAMLVWLKHSRVSIASRALDRGGGIFAQSFEAVDSELQVSGGLAPVADAMLGSGAFLQGPLRLVRSTMRLQDLQGESGLVSRCMELDNSTLSLDSDAGQGLNKGIALQNAGCTCHAALQIHGGIRAVGVNSALFSVDACGNETLHVSHVHLQALHAAVAEARAHTALSNVTVEYLQPLQPVHDGMAPLVVAPSFEAQSVEISCQSCGPNGVTFAADGGKLSAVSSRSLRCDAKASLVEGSTALCTCVGQQVTDPSYGQAVQASEALNYCIYCPPQFEAIDGECQKCPLHKATSKG